MSRIQLLFILNFLVISAASGATQEKLPSAGQIQAYFTKAYSGQLAALEVAEIASLLRHAHYQKHIVTILVRAAQAIHDSDVTKAVLDALVAALPTLQPQVRKDALSFLLNHKDITSTDVLATITASFATSAPGIDLLKLKNLFWALIKKGADVSEDVIAALCNLAVNKSLNTAVRRAAMELLAHQNRLTVELLGQYNGQINMQLLVATRNFSPTQQAAFMVKKVVEGRLRTNDQRTFVRHALNKIVSLSLDHVRALIDCLYNKTLTRTHRQTAAKILADQVNKESSCAGIALVALCGVAHQSFVSLKKVIEKSLSWQSPTLKSQQIVQQAFDNLCSAFFKAPNQLVRGKVMDLLLLISNSKNVALTAMAQKKLIALIQNKAVSVPKETAVGTGATL